MQGAVDTGSIGSFSDGCSSAHIGEAEVDSTTVILFQTALDKGYFTVEATDKADSECLAGVR